MTLIGCNLPKHTKPGGFTSALGPNRPTRNRGVSRNSARAVRVAADAALERRGIHQQTLATELRFGKQKSR